MYYIADVKVNVPQQDLSKVRIDFNNGKFELLDDGIAHSLD